MQGSRRRVALTMLLVMIAAPWTHLAAASATSEETSTAGRQSEASTYVYNLFLDDPNDDIGDDVSITTLEPDDGAQHTVSILGTGKTFRTDELRSDLTVYNFLASGSPLDLFMRFTAPREDNAQERSTATVTVRLEAGSNVETATLTLEDPCVQNLLNTGCGFVNVETSLDLGAGFLIEAGERLEIDVDATVQCVQDVDTPDDPQNEEERTQGRQFGGGDCDVELAWGDVENQQSNSRLTIKANALSGSEMRIHREGGLWNDRQVLEWAPNHRPDYRTVQFSVDVRNAFGRVDIQSIDLLIWSPTGFETYDEEIPESALTLDAGGLVGDVLWTYNAGLQPGDYSVALQITDVQGNQVNVSHPGFTILRHDLFLELPSDQPPNLLIAPGRSSSIEFLIEHIGDASEQLRVEMDVNPPLPNRWADPVWDRPAGYDLPTGGTISRPILTIQAPSDDVSDRPPELEIIARAYGLVEGVEREVRVATYLIGVEEVDVHAVPRIQVYGELERQAQIADSGREGLFDANLSHYIDASTTRTFALDLTNEGFDTDNFSIRILNPDPLRWGVVVADNSTGAPLPSQGGVYLSPEVVSHTVMPLNLVVTPPPENDRVAEDIIQLEVLITSVGNSSKYDSVEFTVHRTFGVQARVINDGDGGVLGTVGPLEPDGTATFVIEIANTDSSSLVRRWVLTDPSRTASLSTLEVHRQWDYEILDENNSPLVVLDLAGDERATLQVSIELSGEIPAGDHRIHIRVAEQGSEDDQRYFDLPLIIQVDEELVQGLIEVTRRSEDATIVSNGDLEMVFRVYNGNNVPVNMNIIPNPPDDWTVLLRSDLSPQSTFLSLSVGPFQEADFTMTVSAPDGLRNNDAVPIPFTIQPSVGNAAATFVESQSVSVLTQCEGIDCLLSEITDPRPNTVLLFAVLAFLGVAWVYSNGRRSGRGDKDLVPIEDQDPVESTEAVPPTEEDLPPPVLDEVEAEAAWDDLEDELELIE